MAATSENSGNWPDGSNKQKEEGIDDMLHRLGIGEDDFDDLVFEEIEGAPKEAMKWMALARVHTTNYFSLSTFEQHMRVAWSPAREINFQHIEGNLFTVQCSCLGDWLKVEKGGPWLFRQSIVCIEPYDGVSDPYLTDLNCFTTWVQIQKLQVGYRNNPLITNLIERKVGKVVEIQTDVQGAGNFVRVKVKLDVRKVLERFVSMSREGKREIFQLKYEKMPRFCGSCGFIGHSHLECGTGEHIEEELRWGEWLKADRETWYGRGGPAGRGGGRGGRGARFTDFRGGGRGRDPSGREPPNFTSWRHNALPLVEGTIVLDPALKDTASSPLKGKDMDIDNDGQMSSGAKRNLNDKFSEEAELPELRGNGPPDGDIPAGMMSDLPPMEVGQEKGVMVGNNRTKRTKKDGADSSSIGSVSSREELVRSQ
ncbi:hypothetical protein QYE76_048576 [Lolium multiflorum]|uniref:DUF4283 domain-containing protein n=1 Tax=Lolium multiflorum TaxID=4521 RepID=A0AAD8SLB0_LOLMU|nr:hypothetical protein QYE76_048576 [Lolium multiflorum]